MAAEREFLATKTGSLFSKRANRIFKFVLLGFLCLILSLVSLGSYISRPQYVDVGYKPSQPVAFNHKLHAGDLGIDCRFCHTAVEKSAVASIPSTQTCINCH